MEDHYRLAFGKNIRRIREGLGLSQEELGDTAKLDRSYIGGVERGERNPSLSAILSLSTALRIPASQLFEGVGDASSTDDQAGGINAVETNDGLVLRFKYDQFDAEYLLPGAKRAQYDQIIDVLRSSLNTKRKTHAVAQSFRQATLMWPDANPSDLWTFLINRAYCDRANHPAANSRLNLEQSWKRTSGWALEQVLVEHYSPFLKKFGLAIRISRKPEKLQFLGSIGDPRIIPDKADVLIFYKAQHSEQFLGVVHVKASIAERRTDDVPMSRALIDAGYLSIFWTMDSKSFPSPHPFNRGEFGEVTEGKISDKRRDFEEHGYFSACFSYNKNTLPTLSRENAVASIFVCDFTNPDDAFAGFLIDALHQRLNH